MPPEAPVRCRMSGDASAPGLRRRADRPTVNACAGPAGRCRERSQPIAAHSSSAHSPTRQAAWSPRNGLSSRLYDRPNTCAQIPAQKSLTCFVRHNSGYETIFCRPADETEVLGDLAARSKTRGATLTANEDRVRVAP